ncbi:YggS family pyridoxal phosphate-dependent enzyme [Candidatus Pacearchaeota archaeon]|nr:YggS family pyridoxal phosphate-dependent enzyme [Candidatus Pacearchaeota archaeon]
MITEKVKRKIKELKERVKNVALRADRALENIEILYATKYLSAKEIVELIKIEGKIIIGENRVQDTEKKIEEIEKRGLRNKIELHMIGHLQSNKASKAVEIFDCIQSVDTLKLAGKINKHTQQVKKIMHVYLEVNISEEPQKFGFPVEEIKDAYDKIKNMKNLKIIGLMTMALEIEPEKTRHYFKKMKEVASSLGLKTSMGMSNDFEVAIEEGSDMIRIGRAIFQ